MACRPFCSSLLYLGESHMANFIVNTAMAAAPFVLSLTNNTNKHDAGQAANAILQVFRMT